MCVKTKRDKTEMDTLKQRNDKKTYKTLTTTEAEPESVAPMRSVIVSNTGLSPSMRLVGLDEGCVDGVEVGWLVGLVGWLDGWLLGWLDGAYDGSNVGFDGICVGLTEGDRVVGLDVLGLTVGAVGVAEGVAWGTNDGTAVGGLEGSLDG